MSKTQTVVWGLDGIALKGKKALPFKHLQSNQASMPAKKPDCRGAQGRPFPPRPPWRCRRGHLPNFFEIFV